MKKFTEKQNRKIYYQIGCKNNRKEIKEDYLAFLRKELEKYNGLKEKITYLTNHEAFRVGAFTIKDVCFILNITRNKYNLTINTPLTKKCQEKTIKNPYYSLIKKVKKFKSKNKNYPIKDYGYKDLIKKFGDKPKCYLTGIELDYFNGESYHLDHVIPASKGGSNELDNMQIASKYANIAKNNLSVDELIDLCKNIINYQESLCKF